MADWEEIKMAIFPDGRDQDDPSISIYISHPAL
jgi:hypothetical protein